VIVSFSGPERRSTFEFSGRVALPPLFGRLSRPSPLSTIRVPWVSTNGIFRRPTAFYSILFLFSPLHQLKHFSYSDNRYLSFFAPEQLTLSLVTVRETPPLGSLSSALFPPRATQRTHPTRRRNSFLAKTRFWPPQHRFWPHYAVNIPFLVRHPVPPLP